jgi:hypothetical protein
MSRHGARQIDKGLILKALGEKADKPVNLDL